EGDRSSWSATAQLERGISARSKPLVIGQGNNERRLVHDSGARSPGAPYGPVDPRGQDGAQAIRDQVEKFSGTIGQERLPKLEERSHERRGQRGSPPQAWRTRRFPDELSGARVGHLNEAERQEVPELVA